MRRGPIGGTLSGLSGTLVLQNNAGDNLTLTAASNGSFSFATRVASAKTYAVTVLSSTNPVQSCTVTNGTGLVSNTNVNNITVACIGPFALRFGGGIVTIPGSASLNDRTLYTLEGWISRDAADGTYQGLLSQDNGGCCSIRMLIAPGMNPFVNAGAHVDVSFPGFTFAAQTWYHWAMTCSGGVATIFVGGAQVGTTACIDPGDQSAASIYLGAGEGGGPYRLTGKIAEVRVSNIARYSSAFAPQKRFASDANTMLLLHFDTGSGTTAFDSSGQGNNGSFSGNVTWVADDRP